MSAVHVITLDLRPDLNYPGRFTMHKTVLFLLFCACVITASGANIRRRASVYKSGKKSASSSGPGGRRALRTRLGTNTNHACDLGLTASQAETVTSGDTPMETSTTSNSDPVPVGVQTPLRQGNDQEDAANYITPIRQPTDFAEENARERYESTDEDECFYSPEMDSEQHSLDAYKDSKPWEGFGAWNRSLDASQEALSESDLGLWDTVRLSYSTVKDRRKSPLLAWKDLVYYASRPDVFLNQGKEILQFDLQVALALIYFDANYDNFERYFAPLLKRKGKCHILATQVLRYSLELPTVGPRAAAYLQDSKNFKKLFPRSKSATNIGAFPMEIVTEAVSSLPSLPAAFPPGTEPSPNSLRNFFLNIDYCELINEKNTLELLPLARAADSFRNHEPLFKLRLFEALLLASFTMGTHSTGTELIRTDRPHGSPRDVLLKAIAEATSPYDNTKSLAMELFEAALRKANLPLATWICEQFDFNYDRAAVWDKEIMVEAKLKRYNSFVVVQITKHGYDVTMQMLSWPS